MNTIDHNANNSQPKQKLISIHNLKKYFEIKKEFLQKEHLYLKANDGITLDIYEGETLGLVGESGCGKSTLGRVILQLYNQTDGQTIYYGINRDKIVPKYEKTLLKNYPQVIKAYNSKLKEYNDFSSEYSKMHEHNRLENHGKLERLRAEKHILFLNITEVLGGFLIEDTAKGVKLLTQRNSICVEINKIVNSAQNNDFKLNSLNAQLEQTDILLQQLREKHIKNTNFTKAESFRHNGVNLALLTTNEMRCLRKSLQLIFQDPYSSLNPRMNVGQIISEGLNAHYSHAHFKQGMHQYVLDVMSRCGLSSYMADRYPHEFSGGQRQRIGIARSLAPKPKFVVCDEAVSALDVSIQSQILNLLMELKKEENLTYLFITHDLSVVKYISDRVGVMYLGKIVELSHTQELFDHTMHPYTQALLLAIPTTHGDKNEIVPLEGDVPSPIGKLDGANSFKGCAFHQRCKYATDICRELSPELKEVDIGHFVACHNRLC